MKYRTLGVTGKRVFVIGIGTYGHGDAYGSVSSEESLHIFRSILEKLIPNAYLLADTAPLYGFGRCEDVIGQVIQENRNVKMLVATKGGRHIEKNRRNERDFSLDFLKMDLIKSLNRLRTRNVFLYQLHNPGLEVIAEGRVFGFLEEFRRNGLIDYYGVSVDNPEDGVSAIEICKERGYPGLASIQVVYNILKKEAEKELFQKAQECNIAIIAREPLLRGFLTGKYKQNSDLAQVLPTVKKIVDMYGSEAILRKVDEIKYIVERSGVTASMAQIAIKFASSHPAVTVAIPGINRIEYVKPNFYDVFSIKLDNELLSMLRSIKSLEKIQ